MPRRYLFLILGLAIFCVIFLMVAFKRQAPVTPGDEIHRAIGESREAGQECMQCHGPGGAKPRGPNHPFGELCGECHFRAGEAGAPR